MLLFGTFLLSRPVGFTLHFLCSTLFCCKKRQSCRHAASIYVMYPYPHRAHGPTVFPAFDNVQGHTHALCPLAHQHLPQRLLSPQQSSHTNTCRSDCCPLSDPHRRDPHGQRFVRVILFKKPTIMALIGNYIHRVNVIKRSLYS